ncbi:hypothetical protein QTP70_011645 [Hemibagrus guttatus]|uniref:NADH dehydrogenase [ubiquinone] 1 beta subcomplex subunit 2, mitochondrial n=1 Tax=Hemibagrus guttatus TaxID=175788 RepID=A0AAE0QBB3_9TELE|nr:hypothetical protein QTP70_011645 [Hemibagrus guttatus]
MSNFLTGYFIAHYTVLSRFNCIYDDMRAGDSHIVAQYRQLPQLTKRQKFRSELLSGFMWFWILWHCWHDSDAVLISGP